MVIVQLTLSSTGPLSGVLKDYRMGGNEANF